MGLGLLLSLVGGVDDGAEAFAETPALSETPDVKPVDDRALFVIGNTLFTVYHELGHALIELLDLPVIGREEDAVDGFAALSMIPTEPDEIRDALIVAVADGWRLQSDRHGNSGEPAFWAEHALEEQRHFAIVCWMVGSDQEGFYDFALDSGLPDERIETCRDDFIRMKTGWERLLAAYRPASSASGGSEGKPIRVLFDEPSAQHRHLAGFLQEQNLLERVIVDFKDSIALPVPIVIRFASCDEANAYWSGQEREVTVCYELIDEYDSMLFGTARRF